LPPFRVILFSLAQTRFIYNTDVRVTLDNVTLFSGSHLHVLLMDIHYIMSLKNSYT